MWEYKYHKSIYGGSGWYEWNGIPASCFKPFEGLEVWVRQIREYTWIVYTRAGEVGWISASHTPPGSRFTLDWEAKRHDEPREIKNLIPILRKSDYVGTVKMP